MVVWKPMVWYLQQGCENDLPFNLPYDKLKFTEWVVDHLEFFFCLWAVLRPVAPFAATENIWNDFWRFVLTLLMGEYFDIRA